MRVTRRRRGEQLEQGPGPARIAAVMGGQGSAAGDAGGDDAAEAAILDAARECVLAFGVRRTSLSEVARRAQVSRPTVYRRWPDRTALVADLMTREWAGVFGAAEVRPRRLARPSASGRSPGSSRSHARCAGTRCCARSWTWTRNSCSRTSSTGSAPASGWRSHTWPDGCVRAARGLGPGRRSGGTRPRGAACGAVVCAVRAARRGTGSPGRNWTPSSPSCSIAT